MKNENDAGQVINLPDELNALRREIVKLKKAESSLRQTISTLRRSEEFFRLIIQNGADIILIADKQGIITYVSPSVERFLGYKPEEIIGRSGFDLIVLADVPRAVRDFNRAIEAKEDQMIPNVFTLKHKDGSERFLEGVGINMIDDQTVSGFVMNVRDITERRKTEEELHRYRQGLETLVDERTGDLAKTNAQLLVELAGRQRVEQALQKSEVRFRELFGRMASGVAVYEARRNGEEFVFTDINLSGERMLQVKRGEILERSLLEALPHIRGTGLFEAVQRVWRTGMAEQHPVSLYQNGQLTRWVENVVYKLPSGEVVVVSDDMTTRKRMEEALRRSEEKYRSLLDNAGDAILSADEEGRIAEANRKAEELLGYTIGEMTDNHISMILPSDERDRIRDVFRDLVRTSGEKGLTTHILTKSGQKVPVEVTWSVIECNGRKIVQGIFRDITGAKMKENALLASRDEMERRVLERTAELEKANKDLEEANVALRVLLNRQTEDNKKLEERLQVNIEELVIPYLEKLKQAGLNGRYLDYLTLLEANLTDIVSPFIQNISAVYRNLTPTEIRVAEMIKQGKASKDIAEILNASVGTINTHRNNIRKKLNLRRQNKNLRSYLLTLG